MAAAAQSLDIPELQFLIEFPGDPNGLTHHHRIFWYRDNNARWVVSTADYDVYVEDYAARNVIPLVRNAPCQEEDM